MSRIRFHGLLMILAAPLLFSGCSDEPCDKCQASGDCPNLSGSYDVWLQVGFNECGFYWGSGLASLSVSQTQVNPGEDSEWARLDILLSQGFAQVSMQGVLCDSRDDASPKSYKFNGAFSTGSVDDTTSHAIGGDFIVDTETDICASLTATNTIRDDGGEFETCSMSALVYTNQEICK